jgi:hypothetical protein
VNDYASSAPPASSAQQKALAALHSGPSCAALFPYSGSPILRSTLPTPSAEPTSPPSTLPPPLAPNDHLAKAAAVLSAASSARARANPPLPLPAASDFGPFGNAVALCLLRSHGGASAKIRQQEEDVSQQLGEAHRMVSEGRADVRMFTRSIASFCLLLRQMTRNLLSSCVHTVRIEDAHRDCSCRTQCRPAVLHPLIYP